MSLDCKKSTVSWRKNTLRPFESMASLGAKYCYLNRVSSKAFGIVLVEFLPPYAFPSNKGCTVDIDGFNISGFSKMLGEPATLIKTQSVQKFYLGATFQEICAVSELNFDRLRYCPACLADGYHSTLHQISWLSKCFIHSLPLVQHTAEPMSINSCLSGDSRLTDVLYQSWFGADRVWRNAHSFTWPISNSSLIYQSAKNLFNKFKATESELLRIQRCHEPLPRIISNSECARVMMLMKAIGTHNKNIVELLKPKDCSIRPAYCYQCTPEQANTILQLSDYDLSVLMHGRQLMCTAQTSTPSWKVALKGLENRLIHGHEKCLQHFQKLCFVGQRTRIPGAPYELDPPFDLSLFSKLPCRRLGTIHCFEEMIDVEEEANQASRLSLSELPYNRPDWSQAEFSSLIVLFSDFIHRNANRIIHLNSYKTDETISHEQQDADQRRVRAYAPTGPLALVIDQMLLSHLWSWAWALFTMEMQVDYLMENAISPRSFLDYELKILTPIFSMQKCPMGVMLRVGSYIPFRYPPLKKSINKEPNHILEVLHKTKTMEEFFYTRLDKLQEDYQRYLPR